MRSYARAQKSEASKMTTCWKSWGNSLGRSAAQRASGASKFGLRLLVQRACQDRLQFSTVSPSSLQSNPGVNNQLLLYRNFVRESGCLTLPSNLVYLLRSNDLEVCDEMQGSFLRSFLLGHTGPGPPMAIYDRFVGPKNPSV